MREWTADVRVDEALARRLIAGQFAPLPERSLRLVAEGWDYTVYDVDGRWAFRFPRREVAVPGVERELAVLPRLAPLLPVAVPAATHVGRPTDGFPWPFFGAPFLPGVEAGDAALTDGARTALAVPLARALRALHSSEVLAAVGPLLPVDVVGRADMAVRVPRTRDALAAAADLWEAPSGVQAILEEAVALPPAEPAAVCHGDLHFRQLLVDGGRLTGLIDWVDVCRADPGIDLQLLWSFFDPPARAAFLREYGAVRRASLVRARVLAFFLNAVLARYGRDENLGAVQAEAAAGLARAATE
ncbi:MAG: phosphotransferase [Thermoleophilia bacterium]|nr:phosphotransferase [Thermoleophilia bacterium]